MKSAVETLTPTRVKLTVEVPYEELKPSIDAAYATIAQQVQVPGFRRGKVPARIIDQRIGKGAVLQEAVNEALPEMYSKALAESGVVPLSQPEVDVTEIPLDDSQQLAFTAELDVRPTIELPDFTTLSVEVDPVEVSDDDVQAAIAQLQDRFGSLVGVERAVQSGDFVSLDLTATIGDEQIDSVSGISYEVGSATMLDGMDDALVGMIADEEKSFTAPLAGGERAGEDATITLKVLTVKERQLPDLDDDFAQMASEFDTFDDLKADVTAQTERTKKFEQGAQARDTILSQLLETLDIPVPDALVESEVENHFASGHEDQENVEEHRAEVQENTRTALRTQFLLDALAERDEVEVEQEELIEYLVMSAQQYGMDPNQFAQIMDAQGQIPMLVGEVARRKALANVLEQIQIKDTNGVVVNLSDLDVEVEVDDEDELTDSSAETAPAAAAETKAEAEAEAEAKPAKKAAKKAPLKKAAADDAAPAAKAAKKAPAKKSAPETPDDEKAVAETTGTETAGDDAKPAKKAAKKTAAKKAVAPADDTQA